MLQRYFHEGKDEASYAITDPDILKKYVVREEADELEEIVRSYNSEAEGRVPGDLLEKIANAFERSDGYVEGVEYNKPDSGYFPLQSDMVVQRVPQNVLGPNVLGRTWLGTNYIEVLDSLVGDALNEVNHLLYPHENEREIRARTRRQLSSPIYH